jgi:hypothetical protein
MKAKRGSRRISALFKLRARWGWMINATPGPFTSGEKTLYPLYRRLDGPQDRSVRVRKISPPSGFDPQTVQLVASRYTAYAIPARE